MATNSLQDCVEVFKFHSSGVFELCREVMDPRTIHYLEWHDVDFDKAYFENDEERGLHKIIFPRKKKRGQK